MGHIAHLRNQFKSMNTLEWSSDHIYHKTCPVVQEEKIFKFCENTFAILLLSPNVKRCGLSIWTNSNPLYPRMLFAKFGWNWPSGFFNFVNVFSLFRNHHPFDRWGPFIWIINYIPLIQGWFVLKFGWYWLI